MRIIEVKYHTTNALPITEWGPLSLISLSVLSTFALLSSPAVMFPRSPTCLNNVILIKSFLLWQDMMSLNIQRPVTIRKLNLNKCCEKVLPFKRQEVKIILQEELIHKLKKIVHLLTTGVNKNIEYCQNKAAALLMANGFMFLVKF